jgi:hypothetical protein
LSVLPLSYGLRLRGMMAIPMTLSPNKRESAAKGSYAADMDSRIGFS